MAILTNGSLLWNEEIRDRISGADIIMPTLSTVFNETFEKIHRPHPDLTLSNIIDGIKELRMNHKGLLWLEVVLLAGMNDSEKEIRGLKKVIDEISPDKIQLNTVVRPPSDSSALSLDRQGMENIKKLLGNKAEIVAGSPSKQEGAEYDSDEAAILEMAKRRPLRAEDVANVCDIPLEEAESLIKGFVVKGILRQQEHEGEVYYMK